jgi:hypothetical protein
MGNNDTLTADARPTKSFFIQNLTRDLTLEDAILDLVDNAVDSLIRTRGLDVSPAILDVPLHGSPEVYVAIHFTEQEFRIDDRCGGIDLEHARNNVFRFGRTEGSYGGSLGVYGIGLKRALFKIGSEISISSKTPESGFHLAVNVQDWAKDDNNWSFPLEAISKAPSMDDAGTSITIRGLTPEVKMRLGDGALLTRLSETIASTYALFLSRYLGISLNGVVIAPRKLPLAETALLPPNSRTLAVDGVTVSLVAGLQERRNDEWSAERAGWYVLCNGRVVVTADRTDLTGWGVGGPTFVSKHRGFLGIAFFFSDDPAKLPWTTTKRGINRESAVYQQVRKEMTLLARPVLSFLSSFYPSEPAETAPARDLVATLQPADVGRVVARAEQAFPRMVPKRRGKGPSIKVQYDAERADIDRIRKKIGKPGLGAGAVGRFTFEHYLRTECPE